SGGSGGAGGPGGAGGGSPGAGRAAGGRRTSAGGGAAENPAQDPAARLGHVPAGGEPRNRLRPFEDKTPKDTAAMAQTVEALGQQALLGGAELRKAQFARAAEDKALEGLMSEASSQGMGKPPPESPPLATGKTWPVKGGGRVSQEFGPTDFYLEPPRTYQGKKYAHFHGGIDIAAPKGTPVLALDAGKVTFAGGNQQKGVSVVVAHENGLVTTYHHLDLGARGPTVRPGQYIGAGQTVGFIGMTGMTTGPHLHFIAKKGDLVNPRTVLPVPQKK
ncbi:MAG: M23 family metallopeptidase, partial [Elusimicrobiota bacterium]